jgi:hypothetical protein
VCLCVFSGFIIILRELQMVQTTSRRESLREEILFDNFADSELLQFESQHCSSHDVRIRCFTLVANVGKI